MSITYGKYVYKENQSKNAKEGKEMTAADLKKKKVKEDADKKLFKQSPKQEYVHRIMRPIGGLTKKDDDDCEHSLGVQSIVDDCG